MPNLIDYVATQGPFSFAERPLNRVDGVILAQLAYFDFSKINSQAVVCLGDLKSESLIQRVVSKTWFTDEDVLLLTRMTQQPRYRSIRWSNLVNQLDVQVEKQFSAVTFQLAAGLYYLAFRGTRATFVDWKEDLNLAVMPIIPSQNAALKYFQQIAQQFSGRFYLGGHSKGGNLATYAFAHATTELQQRVQAVFNVDGPGLGTPIVPKLRAKVIKLVPQTSLIGVLFDPTQDYQVVASTSHGIRQHSPYSWNLVGSDFQYLAETDRLSQYTNRTMIAWLTSLDTQTKKTVLAQSFAILQATDQQSFEDLKATWPASTKIIFSQIRQTPTATRKQLGTVAGKLIQALVQESPHPNIAELKLKLPDLQKWAPIKRGGK